MIYGNRPCSSFGPLLCLVLWATAAPARADILTVSAAGQFGPGVIADQLAAPGASWALTFMVDSNPAAANSDPFSFDAPFSGFTYLLGGSAVAGSPESIRFFDSGDGGLFTVFFGPRPDS